MMTASPVETGPLANEVPIQRHRGRILALGFGMTAAMWAIAYFSLMGPGLVIGEVLFGLILLCLLGGGVIAGRYSDSSGDGVRTGLFAGLTSALLNLLILGSLVGGETTGDLLSHLVMWTGGTFAVSAALGALGGWIGSRFVACDRTMNWYFVFLCVAATTVFLLLVTGGIVTGWEAGLAVPDWPNTFGHNMLLYPLAEMIEDPGVYYEHSHRLYGMLVGVTAITLAVTIFTFDPQRRLRLRILGIVILLMVIVQGVLGGLRVTGHLTFDSDPGVMNPNMHLAVVHGIFGQVVLASIAAMAAFCSTTWLSNHPPKVTADAPGHRQGAIVLIVLLILQLALGAMYRHIRRDAGDPMEGIHAMYTHIFLAAVVALVALFVGGRAWSKLGDLPILPRLGKSLMHLIGLQILLGIAALVVVIMRGTAEDIPLWEVTVTSIHQATGALILVFATLLAVWGYRLLSAPEEGASSEAVSD